MTALDRWGRPATAICGKCGEACQVIERPQFGDSPLRFRSACCTAYVKEVQSGTLPVK